MQKSTILRNDVFSPNENDLQCDEKRPAPPIMDDFQYGDGRSLSLLDCFPEQL